MKRNTSYDLGFMQLDHEYRENSKIDWRSWAVALFCVVLWVCVISFVEPRS